MSTSEQRQAERAKKAAKKQAKTEALQAANKLLKNVEELRRGAESMKENVVKRESKPIAGNFRKTDKVDKRTEAKMQEVKEAILKSQASSNSLPKIKKSRSGTMSPKKTSGMMSPKKTASSGTMSPKKMKKTKSDILNSSAQNMPKTMKKSSSSTNISSPPKPPVPLFSIGSPGEELASPGEPAIINDPKETMISYEKFKSVQNPIVRTGPPQPKSIRSQSVIELGKEPRRKFGTGASLMPNYDIDEEAAPFTARSGSVISFSILIRF